MDLTFVATPQRVSALMDQLKAGGTTITPTSDNGYLLEGRGITATVKYADPSLTVTVLAKPFYISLGMIRDGISNALLGCDQV